MPEAQHTPGPWWKMRRESLHMGMTTIYVGNHAEMVATIPQGHSLRRANHNARLIAAAPDLLAALEETTDTLESLCNDLEMLAGGMALENLQAIKQGKAAIAKARGE